MLGYTSESLEIGDLPILAASMRGAVIYAHMRAATRRFRLQIASWRPTPGSGLELVYRLVRANARELAAVVVIALVAAGLFYAPAMFLRGIVRYLEVDPERESRAWGLVFCVGLFFSHAASQIREWLTLFFLLGVIA